jgi:hypothetical protein
MTIYCAGAWQWVSLKSGLSKPAQAHPAPIYSTIEMSSWTIYPPRHANPFAPERLRAYFHDPEILWLDADELFKDAMGKPVPRTTPSYYIVNFCGNIHCCPPYGPFPSLEKARDWSQQNLFLKATMSKGPQGRGATET